MSGKFISLTKKNGGCPVCGRDDGACRQNVELSDQFLCIDKHGEYVGGFRYAGKSSDGRCGKYWVVRDNDRGFGNSNRRSDRVINQVTNAKPKEKKWEPEPREVLPADIRDKEYRKAFTQLSLNAESRADLVGRGLSDEFIDSYGFKFLSPNNKVSGINKSLPGLAFDGKSLYSKKGEDGYIIPVLDIDDRIVGYQKRLLGVIDGNKYQWAYKNQSLEYNELPLQHAIRYKEQGRKLYLAEGVLKALIASIIHDENFIGAAGGNFGTSKKTLINAINVLKPSEIILCPDGGSKVNSGVLGNYRRVNDICKSLGYPLQVQDWGQGFNKSGNKDIDELSQLEGVVLLYSEWDMPSDFDGNKPSEGIADDDPDKWVKKQGIYNHSAWESGLNLKGDIKIDAEKCPSHFTDKKDKNKSIGFPDYRQGIGLKLYTGQGKTTAIIKAMMGKYRDMGAIYLPSRNSLGEQFVKDCDTYCDEHGLNDNNRFYMLKDMAGLSKHYSFTADTTSRLVLCPDSLDKFNPKDFDGRVLILDESESSMRHLIRGETLGDRQQKIIELEGELFKRCYCIIMADANLSDSTVNYVQEKSGIPITKVVNTRLPERPKVNLYKLAKKSFELLLPQIAKEPFAWVMSDSQMQGQAMQENLKRSDKNFLRIDSDTINDKEDVEQLKWIRAFLSNPEVVDREDFPYDGIISSPTIESGLSSTSKRFTGVYEFISHLESLFSSQMIMRARNIDCPRHLAINSYVASKDYDSTLKSAMSNQILKNMTDAYNFNLTAFADDIPGMRERLKQELGAIIDNSMAGPEFALFAKYQAIKNYEQQHLEECLIESLQKSGFDIRFADLPEEKPKGYKADLKAVKVGKADLISNAPIITEEAYKSLCHRSDLDKKEKAKKEKHRLLKTLPGIEEPDPDNDGVIHWSTDLVHFMKFKKPLILRQAELRLLTEMPELAKKRNENGWERMFKNKPEFIGKFKDNHPTVKALINLGVIDLFKNICENEVEVTNDSPEIAKLHNEWTREIAIITDIDRGKHPYMLMKRIATKLGYSMKEINKDSEGRVYTIVDDLALDFGPVIYKYMSNALATELEKKRSNQAQVIDNTYFSGQESGNNSDSQIPSNLSFSKLDGIPKTTEPTPDMNYSDDKFSINTNTNNQLKKDDLDTPCYGPEIIDISAHRVTEPAQGVPAQLVSFDELAPVKSLIINESLDMTFKPIGAKVDTQTDIYYQGEQYTYSESIWGGEKLVFACGDKRIEINPKSGVARKCPGLMWGSK